MTVTDIERSPSGVDGAIVRVYAASFDGQAARIAERIVQRINASGRLATLCVLGKAQVPKSELESASLVVLIAAIRYGYHLPAAYRLLRMYKALPEPPPLGLATVCLTARKPNKRTAENNVYLRKLIAKQGLTPALSAGIGGKLDYPRYRWYDRLMIRLIMHITGGPTDGVSVIEYTDWEQVATFADGLSEIAAARSR